MADNTKFAVIGQYSGKACEADAENNNGMTLNRELFEKIINSQEYKDAIERGHYIGFLGHPTDPDCQDFKEGCIVMRSMALKDNNDVEAEFDLINTPVGQLVKTFQDAGVKFGISIRGAGDVDPSGYVDPDTFIFRGFDLVAFPAYNDCVPDFKEIAASTDSKKKAIYNSVCKSVSTNIKYIKSCNTLEIIRDQFVEGSPEYNEVNDRISELNTTDEMTDEANLTEVEVLEQKLKGVTELLVQEKAENKQLLDEIVTIQSEAKAEINASTRKVNALKRITANQIRDLSRSKDKVVASNSRLSYKVNQLTKQNAAIQSQKDKLIQQVTASKDDNLKYNRKIVASRQTISEQQHSIDDLKSKLNETVTQSRKHQLKASNLDAKNKELEARVVAAEDMLLKYQQAYANIYATALGVRLDNIPVTASTSVEQLQRIINSSTSSANIAARPDIDEEFEDEITDVDFSDDITVV